MLNKAIGMLIVAWFLSIFGFDKILIDRGADSI
jgi:TM2 domain-containing membrane protein YozV